MFGTIVLLFFQIVQGLIMAYVGAKIVGESATVKKLGLIALIYGVTIQFVRSLYELLEFPLGTHSFVLLIIFVVLLKQVLSTNWGKAFTAGIITVGLAILGGFVPMAIIEFSRLTYEQVFESIWLFIPIAIAESTLLIIAAIALKLTGYKIYNS